MTPAQLAYSADLSESNDHKQTIEKHLPQVYYIAKRIHERLPPQVQLGDLVNEGVLGLLSAMRTYDATKSTFEVYAKHRIRGTILDSLRSLDWAPRELRRKAREIDHTINQLQTELGRHPSGEELSARLGMNEEELHQVLAKLDSAEMVSQQVMVGSDEGDFHDLIETAPDPGADPFTLVAHQETKEQLAIAIAELSEREQLLVSLYYREELTMKEIAAVLGVSQSRVSQTHSMIVTKLRVALHRGGRPPRSARRGIQEDRKW